MFIIFLSIIVTIVLFVLFGLHSENGRVVIRRNKAQILAPLGLLIVLFGMITKVGAVQEGVLYDPLRGGIQGNVIKEGLVIKAPWAKLYTLRKDQQSISYNYSERGEDTTFSVQTANGEFAVYAVEIKYKNSDTSKVYKEFLGMPTSEQLSQYVQTAIKSIASGHPRTDYTGAEGQVKSGFTIYEILGNKFETTRFLSEELLREIFKEFGLELISLNFMDIDAGVEIESMIVEQGTSAKLKQINENLRDAAAVAKETAEIEAQGLAAAEIARAEGQAQAVILQAEAEKQAQILQAEAEQESQMLIAEGEAEAIRLVTEANQDLMTKLGFTPEQYEQYIIANNWDGELPETVLSETADILLNR
ncbi:hypothetical protein KHQ82_03460 [Mycoplasmatota bacterium]|nr:hypothetical protein KHQ82_03460 [Mycoplasmatota bacterium]